MLVFNKCFAQPCCPVCKMNLNKRKGVKIFSRLNEPERSNVSCVGPSSTAPLPDKLIDTTVTD